MMFIIGLDDQGLKQTIYIWKRQSILINFEKENCCNVSLWLRNPSLVDFLRKFNFSNSSRQIIIGLFSRVENNFFCCSTPRSGKSGNQKLVFIWSCQM